jgi:hypothetical protein
MFRFLPCGQAGLNKPSPGGIAIKKVLCWIQNTDDLIIKKAGFYRLFLWALLFPYR